MNDPVEIPLKVSHNLIDSDNDVSNRSDRLKEY
jgi:hypothetical protein